MALEGPLHRALGRDHLQALDLLLAEVRRHPHDQLEAGRAAALGGRVAAVDLQAVAVPAFALGVHLHRHGGTAGQRRREQLLRARAHVLPALLDGLVDGDRVAPGLHVVRVALALARDRPHRTGYRLMGSVYEGHASSKGLNTIPVSTFGKKYVDFGGMFSPAAATSRTRSTGVAVIRNAASYSPASTLALASSGVRA